MTVVIEHKDGSIENMAIDEFTRWMCLAEAFHFIEIKAKELKRDVENLLKPMAIEVYIKERYPSMRHDVECECKMGNL